MAILSLQLMSVRQFLLGHLSNSITTRSQIDLRIRDFDLSLLASKLVVDDIALHDVGASQAFLDIERVTVDWNWTEILRRRPRLSLIEVSRPRVDLEAPLPGGDEETPNEPPAREGIDLGIDVTTLHLIDGSVIQAWSQPRGWLADWRLLGLSGQGSYEGRELTFESSGSTLRPRLASAAHDSLALHPAADGFEPGDITLDVRFHGQLPATFELDTLTAKGRGLDLRASGRVDPRNDVLQTLFQLDANPRELLPGVADDGSPIHASGDLDLLRLEGHLDLTADRLPVRLFEPWIEPRIYEQWILADSFLSSQASLRLSGPQAAGISGQASLAWRTADEVLVETTLKTLAVEEDRLRVNLSGRLLPASDGDISWQGNLTAPNWQRLAESRIESSQLIVDLPRPLAFHRQLERRWPILSELSPAAGGTLTSNGLTLLGPWNIRLAAQGPWQNPRTELRWTGWQGALAVEAKGLPASLQGSAKVRAKSLDLSSLQSLIGTSVAGRLDLDLQVEAGPKVWRAVGNGDVARFTWQDQVDSQSLRWSTTLEGQRVAGGQPGDLSTWLPSQILFDTDLGGTSWSLPSDEGAPQEGRFENLRLALDLQHQARSWNVAVDGETDGWLLTAADGSTSSLQDVQLEASGQGQLTQDDGLVGLTLDRAGFDHLGIAEINLSSRLGELSFDPLQPAVEDVRLRLAGRGDQWTLDEASLRWGEMTLDTTGRARLGPQLEGIHFETRLTDRRPHLAGLRAVTDIDGGVLRTRLDEVASSLGAATVDVRLPLANLGRIEALRPLLAELPVATVGGPLEIDIDVPRLDSASWLEFFQQPPSPWDLESGLRANVALDLARPEEGSGDILLRQFRFTQENQSVRAEDDLRIRWQGERLELFPSTLIIGGQSSVTRGTADLRWQQDAEAPFPIPEVVDWQGHLEGDVGLSFLRPYLPSGTRTEGSVAIRAELDGNLASPRFKATLEGNEGRLLLSTPYAIEVTQPRAEVHFADEILHIDSAEAKINSGSVVANGQVDTAGTFRLQGVLDAIRMRVDYGVIAQLSGNFDFTQSEAEGSALTSNLLVERAILRRSIDIDNLLLSRLFAPPEIVGLEAPGTAEDDIALDLSIATIDGLRVRNNLADLRATWSPIRVRGTLRNPLIQGDIDAESGGLLSVYGQTLRLDRAQVTFPGVPGVAPIIDLATTSSLEDPTVGQGRSDLFAEGQGAPAESVEQQLASGLATYYGNALASRLGSGLGSRTRLSIRPLLIFGESDPEARLTLTRDLSANLALAAAVSLQDTQRRTYVLDVHNLPPWPAFIGQAFTNEQGQAGVTLQHSWEPGKGEVAETEGTFELRRIDLQMPDYLPRKTLKRTVERAVGERFDDGADFDVEIDVAEALQRLGYSAADVRVDIVNRGGDDDEADLMVAITPGIRSEVLFTGTSPPRDQQASIVRLYRPNIPGAASFDEMRERALQVFRGQGYAETQIEITRRQTQGEDGRPLEQILVDSQTGPRLSLGPPVFSGVDESVVTLLQERFTSRLQRMELALGTEAAREQVLSSLRGLGFVEPEWIESRYDDEGKVPVVEVTTGPRRRIARFEVQGLDADDHKLDTRRDFRPGSPLRLDLLSQAALTLESRLRNDGYSSARVTPTVAEQEEGSLDYDVVVDVQRGPATRLREVEVSGSQHTRESWVRRIANLPDTPRLKEKDITLARRRLLATGIFRRAQIERLPVAADVDADGIDGGSANDDDDSDTQLTDVLIDVQERPRFRIATGLRWESSEGASAVFDVLDRSFTQRGTTLGLRGLIGKNDRAFRVYTVVPRFLASHNDLELFVEHRWEERDGVQRQRWEGSFQLSRRLGLDSLLRFYGSYRRGITQFGDPSGSLGDFSNPFLGVQWIYGEQQPGKLFPTRPFVSVDLTGSSESISAEQDFLRLFASMQYFHRRPGKRWVWGQSLRLGWAEAFDEPLIDDLRFRTGGEYSVRGYSTDGLGPRVLLGDRLTPFGGEALLVLNQEVRFPLWWEQLAGLVFFDVGNVWEDKTDIGQDLATSLGVGLRYDSPVGPLRFDVAYPLDRRSGDSEIKLYFGFGNIF